MLFSWKAMGGDMIEEKQLDKQRLFSHKAILMIVIGVWLF
jgi:hypothetical protein